MVQRNFITHRREDFSISNDPAKFDIDLIHRFLSGESYWAQGTSRQATESTLADALCYGVYHGEQQIGFASVVSDLTTFAYLSDFFIIEAFRGRGLSKWLLEVIAGNPDMGQQIDWMLMTDDAHGLYEQFDFKSIKGNENFMEKRSES